MDGAVGDGSQLLIVGDDDEGLVQLIAQFEEEVVQLYLIVRVETARRLIGEDHQGVVDQRTGDRHTLLLTTGELCRLVLPALGQSHHVEQLFRLLFRCGVTHVAYQRGDHHVLQRGELGQQLMKLKDESDMLVAEVGELLLVQQSQLIVVNEDPA